MCCRGGTVHRSHGLVRTSVQTSRFGTSSVQWRKKQNKNAEGNFFLLCMSQAVPPKENKCLKPCIFKIGFINKGIEPVYL